MVTGFWKTLPKPFFALAPMANVTDAAFRAIILQCGKPDVLWTEFVSATGLCSRGRERLLDDLRFSSDERPIVAQLFGSNPQHMEQAAALVRELGFDGVDINMGCPDRAVERQGAGAALIKKPELAQELIYAAQRGAHPLPVSVKTRIGYHRDTLETWLPVLLETRPAAITLHARTRAELSLVPAHWETIARAVAIRNAHDESPSRTLIIGNGDVASLREARARVIEYKPDGIMIGRGIFGNPWFFARPQRNRSIRTRLMMLTQHTMLFEKMFAQTKSFDIMKKHYRAYVQGFPGAKELRMELMEARTARAVGIIVRTYLKNHPDRARETPNFVV